jgi:hypothetical protein
VLVWSVNEPRKLGFNGILDTLVSELCSLGKISSDPALKGMKFKVELVMICDIPGTQNYSDLLGIMLQCHVSFAVIVFQGYLLEEIGERLKSMIKKSIQGNFLLFILLFEISSTAYLIENLHSVE